MGNRVGRLWDCAKIGARATIMGVNVGAAVLAVAFVLGHLCAFGATTAHAQTIAPAAGTRLTVECQYVAGWRPCLSGVQTVFYATTMPGMRVTSTNAAGTLAVSNPPGLDNWLGVVPNSGALLGAPVTILSPASGTGRLSVSVGIQAFDTAGKACSLAATYPLTVGQPIGEAVQTIGIGAGCRANNAAEVPSAVRLAGQIAPVSTATAVAATPTQPLPPGMATPTNTPGRAVSCESLRLFVDGVCPR